jgi:hypothetical protein
MKICQDDFFKFCRTYTESDKTLRLGQAFIGEFYGHLKEHYSSVIDDTGPECVIGFTDPTLFYCEDEQASYTMICRKYVDFGG